MSSTSLPSVTNDLDFSFVYELDEDSLNLFFDIVDLSIEEMYDVIKKDLDQGETYLHSLSYDRNIQIHAFYSKLLDLYTDYELYEECDDLVFILSTLEKYQEGVGNTIKKL